MFSRRRRHGRTAACVLAAWSLLLAGAPSGYAANTVEAAVGTTAPEASRGPQPATPQRAMTLKQRRVQVASEKALGRVSSVARSQSGKSTPSKSAGKAKLRAEAATENPYVAVAKRAEVWDASGRLRGWE